MRKAVLMQRRSKGFARFAGAWLCRAVSLGAFAAIALSALTTSAQEEDSSYSDAGPFSKGSIGVSVMVGSAYLGEKDYFIFGLGLSYFVVDGLSLGVDGSIWLFDDPTLGTITPNARYVLHMVPVIKPYVGGFWKRYLVEEFDDFSSVGGRVGAFLMPSRSYIGIGAVYEHMLDCNEVILECDSWYPELTFGISL